MQQVVMTKMKQKYSYCDRTITSTVKCRKTMADIQTTSENLQGKDTVSQKNTNTLKKTEE